MIHRLGYILTLAMPLFGLETVEARAQAADASAIVHRLDELENSVNDLTSEIARLTRLLEAALPPAPVVEIAPIDLRLNAPTKGSPAARVVLIEYADFQCPYCAQYANATYREIQRNYVDTGKIRYTFRHLPLEQLHPQARSAAEAAECAREQDHFWDFHDRLFANQKALGPADLESHARALQLDVPRFQACFTAGKVSAAVSESVEEANRLGLTGTPAFLIGEVQSNGAIRVTRRISGAQPFGVFQAALESILQTSSKH